MYNFIKIANESQNFFAQFFFILSIFLQIKTFGVELPPPTPPAAAPLLCNDCFHGVAYIFFHQDCAV